MRGEIGKLRRWRGAWRHFGLKAAQCYGGWCTRSNLPEGHRTAASDALAGILGFEERPLVSVDYVNDPRSAIVDALSTMVVAGTQAKVYAWYDNEWGYANRLVELAAIVARSLGSR